MKVIENFGCDRTCPMAGERRCRFRPILDALGPVRVDSNTVTIQVQFQDVGILQKAVEEMKGSWLGLGKHQLYQAAYQGHGFRLPNWAKPLVLQEGGKLKYDNHNGAWGRIEDLKSLEGEYSIQMAVSRANNLGWQHEKTEEGLRVHHPSGGSMVVRRNGTAEALGFNGVGCHSALTSLGVDGDFLAKPEMNNIDAKIETTCQ